MDTLNESNPADLPVFRLFRAIEQAVKRDQLNQLNWMLECYKRDADRRASNR